VSADAPAPAAPHTADVPAPLHHHSSSVSIAIPKAKSPDSVNFVEKLYSLLIQRKKNPINTELLEVPISDITSFLEIFAKITHNTQHSESSQNIQQKSKELTEFLSKESMDFATHCPPEQQEKGKLTVGMILDKRSPQQQPDARSPQQQPDARSPQQQPDARSPQKNLPANIFPSK
jgi:hypothetical protein